MPLRYKLPLHLIEPSMISGPESSVLLLLEMDCECGMSAEADSAEYGGGSSSGIPLSLAAKLVCIIVRDWGSFELGRGKSGRYNRIRGCGLMISKACLRLEWARNVRARSIELYSLKASGDHSKYPKATLHYTTGPKGGKRFKERRWLHNRLRFINRES